ncbi:MAG: ribosomal protein S18-alanine N-acetyltransferase [Okeania sp. SIO2C2]|uniref:ribosomal protein S18-alanine N-acetyltransferase n=1 Tax=Okeania sp. SIO2C2 TaxID=2607787 RepID=UPI0013B71D56|nr:ribosomal protein S18-alanine N-acetyltransferase [Okeania sp. SIO2C2]NEP90706.1 ribosomal protein S18-alanine N-acetyltransferase [Okeania sp. SIO2C2]
MAIITIQPMSPKHISSVVELDRLCFGGLWNFQGYQQELESPNSDLLILVISQMNEEMKREVTFKSSNSKSELINHQSIIGIGCLWAILEEAHITILGIHPHYQRLGLGQLLLYSLMRSAWDRELERATLEVAASNTSALSLYHKFGFQDVGRRRGYYQQTGEDALILWRGHLDDPEYEQTLSQWHRQAIARLSGYEVRWEKLESVIGN